MRRVLIAMLTVAVATVLVGLGVRAAMPQPRLLFVGDSLTAGYFASKPAHAFRQLVTAHEHAQAESLQVRYGIRADAVWQQIQHVAIPQASAIIVELGTNDFTGASLNPSVHGAEPQATFNTDYADLVHTLHAADPHAQVICLSVWESPDTWDGHAYAKNYNQAIENACRDNGGVYVDISQFFVADRGPAGRPTSLGPGDNFHPNDAGHAAIAKAIEAALAK